MNVRNITSKAKALQKKYGDYVSIQENIGIFGDEVQVNYWLSIGTDTGRIIDTYEEFNQKIEELLHD